MISQQEFRSHFESLGDRLYFNHAAYAPLSTPVLETMNNYLNVRLRGDSQTWAVAVEHLEGLRTKYSKLAGTRETRIAMMANTVSGINVLATGLEWKAGDHILLYSEEFPANVMPFYNLQSQGVEVEFISAPDGRVTPELFESRIKDRTRLISLSTVQYLTGYRADLKTISDLCHDRDILFSVDAIQSLGVIPMEVENLKIDFLSAGGHKWMMSPLGAGFLYLTEELQSQLQVVNRGYMGHVNPEDYGNFEQELSSDARRFEMGAPNAPSMVGADMAVGLLLECGIDKIHAHVRSLIRQLENGLADTNFVPLYSFSEDESSGIFMFTHKDSERNIESIKSLTEQKVNLSLRGGGLRFAPHFYNTSHEVDQFLDMLRDLS